MNDIPIFRFAIREDLQDVAEKFLPTQAEPHATGWDVRAAMPYRNDLILRAGQYFKIPLGFRAFCPDGWYYQLHPRSSSFIKKQMHNLIGIVDEHFPLETHLCGQYLADINSLGNDLIIKFGDPIAQIIPLKRKQMDVRLISNEEIDNLYSKRNSIRKGGFGSTDKSITHG